MRNVVLASILFLVACGGGGKTPPRDLAGNGNLDLTMPAPTDLAGRDLASLPDIAGADLTSQGMNHDLASCMAPTGATCPTTAGNCLGIGNPCGNTGNPACPAGLICESNICVSILSCTPGAHQCGTGATCCNTATTEHVAVCLPNVCIPDDCTAE
jgi:hypothetical protein